MANFEFKLPDIGEGVVEGEIVKWLIKPGDTVTPDQPMVEVMTDKATVTIPSPRAGKVLKTVGAAGDIAKVHEILVVLDTDGAGNAAAPKEPAAAKATKTEMPTAKTVPTQSPTAPARPAAAPELAPQGA